MKHGQRVMYAAGWLRNTGQFTGPEPPTCMGPFARGEITEITQITADRERQPDNHGVRAENRGTYMITYRVSVSNKAAQRRRSPASEKKYAQMYVRASSPQKARECAHRNTYGDFRCIGSARPATPAELGCYSAEQAAEIVAHMRAEYAKKHG